MRKLVNNGFRFAQRVVFLLLLSMSTGPVYSADSPGEAGVDLRVLIDVSGSMKHTDPKNLRRPALRLLVGLLPETARAGVWTFAKFVNMTVPIDKVNEAWREKARKQADNIHSLGLFTNIEEALQLSTFDWNKPASDNLQRTIILLSDGVVDVSKDDDINKRSRERIINEVLPRLRDSNVTVHTVALSDKADHELLKNLAVSTDGWYEKVDDADTLQRVFLRLFEKSSPVDTLPIEDNIFEVDEHIEDMTLLVFRAENVKPTRILTPAGKYFSAEQHPKNVKWHKEQGFDLITINNPESGAWRMDSKIDPDNRVMVVTNLKLASRKIANHILQGEALVVNANLLQENVLVKEQSLLKYVDFSYGQGELSGKAVFDSLLDDGEKQDKKAGDGIYSAKLPDIDQGKYQVSVIAEGPTFKREAFYVVNVHGNPVNVKIEQADVSEDEAYRVSLIKHLRLKGLSVNSFIVKVDGKELAVDIKKSNKNLWTFYLQKKYSGKKISITINTQVKDRKKIEFTSEPGVPEYVVSETELKETTDGQAEVKTEAMVENEAEVNHEEEIKELTESMNVDQDMSDVEAMGETPVPDKKKKKKKDDIHWILVTAIALFANALLGLLGIGGYFLWKKRRSKVKPLEDAEVTYE